MADFGKEFDELIGALGSDEPVAEPEPVAVEPAAEPESEPVTEPEPAAEPVVTEPVAEPAVESVKEPAATEPVSAPEGWEAEKAELLAKINELSGSAPAPVQPAPAAEPAPAEPAKDLFELFDAAEVVDNPQKFIEFVSALRERLVNEAVQQAYLRMPEVMQKVVVQQAATKETAEKFYTDNPELQSVKQYVGRTATELSAANPDWPMAKVLEETAKVCYTNLRIRKGLATSPAKAPAAPARTAKPGTRGTGVPKLTGLAAEVQELIDLQ
jgi:hypothetical protein